MKKNYLIIVILLLVTYSTLAQNYIFQFRPWDSLEWGYMNINGDVVIEPQRRKCYDFSKEGLALVYYSKRNHYDIINLKNEVLDVEPEKFIVKEAFGYGAQGYSSGLLGFQTHKKWGAMDRRGKVVVPVKYDFLSKFNNGYATARLKDDFFIIDSVGNELQIKEENIVKTGLFSEGLTLVQNKDGLTGFVNTNGEIVIPLKYKNVGYFKSGLAWVRNSDGLIGYINKNDEWIIEPKLMAVSDFDPVSKLAKARVDEVWGYINMKGEITYVENSKKIYDYTEGLAMVVSPDGLFGFLDENQNWIIKPQFEAARDFLNGYAVVKSEGKWGIIDKSGKWIIEPIYSGIKDVVRISEH